MRWRHDRGVIDAHVHHFDLARFRYPWPDDADFEALRNDYLPFDYREDSGLAVGVEGWVHARADVDHALDPVRETEWISELAERTAVEGLPGPLACVVYADLRAADLDDVLARHLSFPLTRGVRQEAWFDPASNRADIPRCDLLSDPAWREGYRGLAGFGLSFDLLVWPSLLGRPREIERVRLVIAELLELFGPRRCKFGSNFPGRAPRGRSRVAVRARDRRAGGALGRGAGTGLV